MKLFSRAPSPERLTAEELEEYMALQQELEETKRKYGVEDRQEGKISHAISTFFDRRETREKVMLSRKKYILLALLTGWMGGHRFYAREYPTAILYLALFWSGFPLAMTIVDLLIVLPMKPDAQGNILL